MRPTIYVETDQEVTDRVREVLATIIDEAYPDVDTRPQLIPVTGASYDYERILVFGKVSERFDPAKSQGELVHTYSFAQLLTKANAASVLLAAIQNMLRGPVQPDVDEFGFGIVWAESVESYESWFDYDKPISIDIETNGVLGKTHTPDEIEPVTLALYQDHWPGALVLVSEHAADVTQDVPPFTDAEKAYLAEFLQRWNKPVYHNGKFDTRVLNRVLGTRLPVWFDTMLAHHVLNHAAGEHGLKPLARRYLGAPDWDKDAKKNMRTADYASMPLHVLSEYNAWDVIWTMELYKLFAPQIEASEAAQMNLYFEQQVADLLLDVEQNGIPLNAEYVDEFSESLENAMRLDLALLRTWTENDSFNPNSPKQIKDWFASTGYFMASTSEAHMLEIAAEGWPHPGQQQVARTILSYRKAAKKLGTYVQGWSRVARDGRVHPTFKVHGTKTGRLASSEPNAQNMPREKEVRKIVG